MFFGDVVLGFVVSGRDMTADVAVVEGGGLGGHHERLSGHLADVVFNYWLLQEAQINGFRR